MDENEDSQFPAIREGVIGGHTVKTVDGRDVHAFLQVGRDYTTWVKDRIDQFGFVENVDYVVVENLSSPKSGSAKARPQKTNEYFLSIGMGKELGMVDRTERGRAIRKYFLSIEERMQEQQFAVPQSFSEALRLAAKQADQIERQKAAILDMTPKAEFHDDVAASINGQDFLAVAKEFGTGRTRLTAWLKEKKILMPSLRPYQYVDAGYFRVSLNRRKDPQTGESIMYTKTLVLGKGLIWLRNRWINDHGPIKSNPGHCVPGHQPSLNLEGVL